MWWIEGPILAVASSEVNTNANDSYLLWIKPGRAGPSVRARPPEAHCAPPRGAANGVSVGAVFRERHCNAGPIGYAGMNDGGGAVPSISLPTTNRCLLPPPPISPDTGARLPARRSRSSSRATRPVSIACRSLGTLGSSTCRRNGSDPTPCRSSSPTPSRPDSRDGSPRCSPGKKSTSRSASRRCIRRCARPAIRRSS